MEERLPNSFYKASITLTPKSDEDKIRKENYSLIPLMNTDKRTFNKTFENRIQ
jgi:hypothetical protein